MVLSPSGSVTDVMFTLFRKQFTAKLSIPEGRMMPVKTLSLRVKVLYWNDAGNSVMACVPSSFINFASERSRFIFVSVIFAITSRSALLICPFITTVPLPISAAFITASEVIYPTPVVSIMLVCGNSTSLSGSLHWLFSCAVMLAVAPSYSAATSPLSTVR